MARLPQQVNRHCGSDQAAFNCASPVAASPMSILSTSPVRGGGAGAAGRFASSAGADCFGLESLGSPTATSAILGTSPAASPWAGEKPCYMRAVGGSPMHGASILGTSPKPSAAGSAALTTAGGSSAPGSSPGSAQLPGEIQSGGRPRPAPLAPSPVAKLAGLPDFGLGLRAALSPMKSAQSSPAKRRSSWKQDPRAPFDSDDEQSDVDDSDSDDNSPILVKNTFIATPLKRTPSFEMFFGTRKVRSSPPSVMNDCAASDAFMINTPDGDSDYEAEDAQAQDFFLAKLQNSVACKVDTMGSAQVLGSETTRAETVLDPTRLSVSQSGSGRVSDAGPATEAHESVVGSAECPSQGSALHKFLACKPCAFVAHGVCRNDVNCPFCHLCEPGEKKRRRKEWLETKRESRKAPEVVRQRQQAPEMQQPRQQPVGVLVPGIVHVGAR